LTPDIFNNYKCENVHKQVNNSLFIVIFLLTIFCTIFSLNHDSKFNIQNSKFPVHYTGSLTRFSLLNAAFHLGLLRPLLSFTVVLSLPRRLVPHPPVNPVLVQNTADIPPGIVGHLRNSPGPRRKSLENPVSFFFTVRYYTNAHHVAGR
jgi:hypothetical protein